MRSGKQADDIRHYPRLDTVLMVEDHIKKHDGEHKRRQLWTTLPKKMMYQTFKVIIDYLLESRKISVDSEGKIGWIYYPDEAKRHHEQEGLERRRRTRTTPNNPSKTSRKHKITKLFSQNKRF